MQIPPRYHITPDILSMMAKIDANKELISSMTPPPAVVEKIHSMSILKSSLYSARIEGHTATFDELDEEKKDQLEIFNILKAIRFIQSSVKPGTAINKKLLIQLHMLAMNGVTGDAGRFRRETTAIFNQAGVAVYMPPLPLKIPEYLNNLYTYINGKHEQFPLINTFIAHLMFEKIHPFIDGNGRVGRLLIYAILQSKGYDFGIHIPLEEYIDAHKQDYYYVLDIGLQQPEDYLQFMVQSYYSQTETIKKQIMNARNLPVIMLPPRQEEIYNIIRDHKTVSLDFIQRRFMKIPARTLRYDLKKICATGLVTKIGKTRGSFYTISKNI